MIEQQQQHDTEVQAEDPADNSRLSLFKESVEMTVSSIFVFALVDLRRLARQHKLQESTTEQEVLRLPMTASRMHELWNQNKEALSKARVRSSDFSSLTQPYFLSDMAPEHREKVNVCIVGDENPSQECVHAIGIDSYRKRIIVGFRGSVTIKDWIQDAKMVIGPVPNPVKSLDPNQPNKVGVHLGFRDYLYGESPSILSKLPIPLGPEKTKDSNENKETKEETELTKMELILNQLRTVREEHPDYQIYFTGHSLGGALALIVALEAAVAFDGGVSCITIGNPKTGNHQFRSAIGFLERTKRLRCLGIHNWLDIVPLMPENVCTSHVDNNFCHVGFQMSLHRHRFNMTYNRPDSNARCRGCGLFACWRDCYWTAFLKTKTYKSRMNLHNYREYMDRLLELNQELRKLTLDDFYNEELDLTM